MRYGIYTSNFGPFADPRFMVQLAREAEDAGWDGFFFSDNLAADRDAPVGGAWTTLAAVAASTTRLRLGPLVTALPRRHLGILARETVTLDQLSEGRLVLGVGSGDDLWREYSAFGPAPPAPELGAMLDEALTVLTGLWRGAPYTYRSAHYQIDAPAMLPTPVERPRIPIWVAGRWPHPRPFRRAARWDGVVPNALGGALTPDDYRAIRAFIAPLRASAAPFDVVHTHPMRAPFAAPDAPALAAFGGAGVTGWLAAFDAACDPAAVRRYIRNGPPPAGAPAARQVVRLGASSRYAEEDDDAL
jgi:alkanesulfonate monooxygenase SsuD/methylene tetrahydromethanopterin reductase-like flavin-dependent oxidoreductase (luciferase family)